MNLQTGAEEGIRLLPEHHVQQIGLYEKITEKGAIIMAYKVIILYRLYMPSYFLRDHLTEYPFCIHVSMSK